MKTLQLIFMALAATLVVASCDDESMNLDKAQVEKVISRNEVNVELTRIGYQLSWEHPAISTQSGYSAFAGDNARLSYDVYVAPAYTIDTLVFITTVDSCGVELSNEEVNAALDSIGNYVQDFVFGVRLSGSDIPNNKVFYSAAQIVDNNVVSYYYETYNRWFTEGARANVNDNNEVVIESESNKDIWDVQFCNVFHCLKNQTQGKRFNLSFDIRWNDDYYRSITSYLTIYTGKYVRKNSNDLVFDPDLQWSDANTQLLFKNGMEDMGDNYEVTSNWSKVQFEGTIGEMGADIIAIQINLSGYERNGVKHTNTDGTFHIKNVIVRIDDEIAAEYFCSYSQYSVDVKSNGSGDVSGGGIYMENKTATLTATPNEGYDFLCWHDVDNDTYRYDNPLNITVDENINLVAEFGKPGYMKPLQYENTDFYFNKWYTENKTDFSYERRVPITVDNNADDDNKFLAYAIEVPSAGNDWEFELYNVMRGNKGQAEGNKFTFDCDVYWERASDNDNDTAVIRLLTGKIGGSGHDDWQWDGEENTELITDNAGGFWGYVFNQPREIPNKEWKHVSWGNELTIGEKGAEYIGIQINLTNPDGTNIGTFYFRNIKISMGNTIYEIDYYDF